MNKLTNIGNTRWFIGLTLVGTLLGILVFIIRDLPELSKGSPSDQVRAAEQVRLCMQHYGLPAPHATLKEASSPLPSPGDVTTFAECIWPPKHYSEPDGYSEIRVLNALGPGLSEAEGATELDRFLAPCQMITVSYSFGNQGNFEHLPSFVAEAGSIMTPEGTPWQGELRTLNFYPERNEIIVVRNLSYVLDEVQCVP
jgi:hypothetical protein